MWILVALGQNSLTLPVIRSSQRTDGHDQVTIHDCFIGIRGPMHAQHATESGWVSEMLLTQQGGGDRCLKFFCKSTICLDAWAMTAPAPT